MTDTAEGGASAPYQSLYRRYRPQRFAEIRGQDHVALALRNAVRDERIAHAYLFSGPRGTGKTSTARILGKALNCTARIDGEPCGVCDSCVSIAAGSSFDVHELDAASNNGVDAMRDLVARASLATPGTWKVYIVDEVHMLSTAASNALLKTLEEPPDHVVFVLATTDPQKVLPTIRSRTQHYEFHLLTDDVLAGLVDDVASAEGLALPNGASNQAVRRAKGSARDALSVLDQVVAAGVIDDDSDELVAAIRAISADDGGAALVALDAAVRAGRDPQQLAVEIVEYLRAGFLSLAGAPSLADGLVRLSPDELNAVRALGIARCVRTMELVGAAIVAMHEAPEPRITLEVALFKAAALDAATTAEALLERIERLEHRLEILATTAVATVSAPPVPPIGEAALPVGAPTRARPALGAFRRNEPPAVIQPTHDAPPPEDARERAENETVASADTVALSEGEVTRPPISSVPSTSSPTSTASASAEPSATPTTEAAPVDVPTPGAPMAAQGGDPTRDELVTAWGDAVLTALRPKARALYQAGRFVTSPTGTARFALPNDAHVQMAAQHRLEVEESLSRHLGRPVRLELVVDTGPSPTPEGAPTDPTPRSGRSDAGRSDAGRNETGRGDPGRGDNGRDPQSDGPSDETDGDGVPPRAASDTSDRASTRAMGPRDGSGGPPVPSSGPPIGGLDDFDDIGTPLEEGDPGVPTGLAWAEDRLRQAFPGAEELSK